MSFLTANFSLLCKAGCEGQWLLGERRVVGHLSNGNDHGVDLAAFRAQPQIARDVNFLSGRAGSRVIIEKLIFKFRKSRVLGLSEPVPGCEQESQQEEGRLEPA